MSDIEIQVDEVKGDGHSRFFELITENGGAMAVLNQAGWLCIANIDVEKGSRRSGIGAALLRRAIVLANDVEANTIYAGLTSRESIDVFTKVFGADSVNVYDNGTYIADDEPDRYDANASLFYEIIPQ